MVRSRTRRVHERIAALGLILVIFALSASVVVSMVPVAKATASHTINMYDYLGTYYFSPKFITIAPGDSVVWHNVGTMTHGSTSNTSAWTQISVAVGADSSPIVLMNPGNYTYYCQYHYTFGMWGAILVSGAIPEFPNSVMIVIGMIGVALVMFTLVRRRTEDRLLKP